MKLEKIKFSELVNDTLLGVELSGIKGGGEADKSGCNSYICAEKINTSYCTDGDGICVSGIGPSGITTAD